MSNKRNVREIPASGKAIVLYREPEFAFEFETVEKWNVVRTNGEIVSPIPMEFEAAQGFGTFLMSDSADARFVYPIRLFSFELVPVSVSVARPIGFRF